MLKYYSTIFIKNDCYSQVLSKLTVLYLTLKITELTISAEVARLKGSENISAFLIDVLCWEYFCMIF